MVVAAVNLVVIVFQVVGGVNMYFSKPINHNCNETAKSQHSLGSSFQPYFRGFSFTDSIQEDKLSLIQDLYQQYPNSRLLPDIASSVIKHLFADGFINKDKFKRILECLITIITDQGYKELTGSDLSNLLNVPKNQVHNVMIIAGCQDSPMLDSRVETAVEIAATYPNNMYVVASGAKPDKGKPSQIDNESARIINLFETGINKRIQDKSKQPRIDVLPENKSVDTKDNVAKFFEGGFLKPEIDNQIIVVSSTSHLIRLSRNIEKYLNDPDILTKARISNIILVGAEGFEKVFYIDNDHLFKHMLLEIYDYMIMKRNNIGGY